MKSDELRVLQALTTASALTKSVRQQHDWSFQAQVFDEHATLAFSFPKAFVTTLLT